jgi:hypothetical protein
VARGPKWSERSMRRRPARRGEDAFDRTACQSVKSRARGARGVVIDLDGTL